MSKRYGITSMGLWAKRAELANILDDDPQFSLCLPGLTAHCDTYVGWGSKASGIQARKQADRHEADLLILEDGFLSSFRPGRKESRHAYLLDRQGVHFDRTTASSLHNSIAENKFSNEDLLRAKRCIRKISELKLSKYNNQPSSNGDLFPKSDQQPYVVLIEQVPGDASVPSGVELERTYESMVQLAMQEYREASIVVRLHPANQKNSLLTKVLKLRGAAYKVSPKCNIWDVFENASAVMTISSHVGFEALMAGKRVHTFGTPFYSGWGLTVDHSLGLDQTITRSLEVLFAAAYLDASRYINVHTGEMCEIETAISQLACIRDDRLAMGSRIHSVGFSPWRRNVLAPFLIGADGGPKHHLNLESAVEAAKGDEGTVAIWGAKKEAPHGVNYIRIEDGFIRSNGLGADLYRPHSICIDEDFLYFDCRGESRLEKLLSNSRFQPEILQRASDLRQKIISGQISKYNYSANTQSLEFPDVSPDRLKILVPGQVIDDASIQFGRSNIHNNYSLVEETRARHPSAFIAYKPHPDVVAKLRNGGEAPKHADFTIFEGGIIDWINWADRLETISSLSGFEALLRNRKVGVYGMPFYAGWGLTDDYLETKFRSTRRNIDELVAATLLLYPNYIHPQSLLPCDVEDLLSHIASHNQVTKGWSFTLRRLAAQLLSLKSQLHLTRYKN